MGGLIFLKLINNASGPGRKPSRVAAAPNGQEPRPRADAGAPPNCQAPIHSERHSSVDIRCATPSRDAEAAHSALLRAEAARHEHTLERVPCRRPMLRQRVQPQ